MRWSARVQEKISDHNVTAYMCTWTELAILFQLQAGYKHLDAFDVSDATAIFKTAMRRACDAVGMWDGTKKISFSTFFGPCSSVGAITPLTGLRLPGIHRRPIVDEERLGQLAALIRAIYAVTPTRAGFGKGACWTPHASAGECSISLKRKAPDAEAPTNARQGPCARGHRFTGNAEGGVPYWPVMPQPSPWSDVPSGSTLCYACYQKVMITSRRNTWRKAAAATDGPT